MVAHTAENTTTDTTNASAEIPVLVSEENANQHVESSLAVAQSKPGNPASEETEGETEETEKTEEKPHKRRGRKPKSESGPLLDSDGQPMANRQKMKMLKLVELLREESDAEHPLYTRQIVEKLKAVGITCDRRTLANDIALLNEYGYSVQGVLIGHEKAYYMAQHDFSVAEIKILVDAVQAAKFITPKKTEELVDKLADLGSSHRAEILKDNVVHFDMSLKHTNESIYENVTKLEEAIQERRKASFRYFDLDENARRQYRHDGGLYVVDPMQLVMDNGNYYLVAYSTKYNDLSNYRVDRMTDTHVEKENRSPEADAAWKNVDEDAKMFGMFGGQTTDVVLEFDTRYISAVQDRFGEGTKMIRTSPGRCIASVRIQAAPTFLGWLFQFVGDEDGQLGMRILSPDSLIEQYKDFARKVIE